MNINIFSSNVPRSMDLNCIELSTISECKYNPYPSMIDYSKKGNRLKINELGHIEIIPKSPAYVVGEYIRYGIDTIASCWWSFTSNLPASSPISSNTIDRFEVKEIIDCDNKLIKGKKDLLIEKTPSPNFSLFECTLLPKDGNLDENLKLGHEILLEVLDAVRYSPNNIERSREILEAQAAIEGKVVDTYHIEIGTSRCLKELRKICRNQNLDDNPFLFYKTASSLAESISSGNCGEMSAVTFFKALEKGLWNIRVEMVYLEGGDHAFVVIGRDPQSDPDDYKTWGPSAVVLDAWAAQVFKLSECDNKLDSFNPLKHQIKIAVANIGSANDFKVEKRGTLSNDLSCPLHKEILQELEKFHKTNILQKKIVIAQSLYSLCSDPDVYGNDFKILKSQIGHFLELSETWLKPK